MHVSAKMRVVKAREKKVVLHYNMTKYENHYEHQETGFIMSIRGMSIMSHNIIIHIKRMKCFRPSIDMREVMIRLRGNIPISWKKNHMIYGLFRNMKATLLLGIRGRVFRVIKTKARIETQM